MQNTSFLQTETILAALEYSLNNGGFNRNAKLKTTARRLVKSMKSTNSVSGRHQQLRSLLKKGASIDQLIKVTGASRRTIFRYLNHFEDAGLDIELADREYRIKNSS
ncbi:MAG: helix-turn-helix domain-containing protein [Phycisphaerae bacterium]